MHNLSDLQSAFHDAHFNNKTFEATKLIVPYGLSGIQRLNIYKNNTFITLTEALSKTYSVINNLVGDDFFTYTANEYLKNNQPRPGPIFEFGENFPDFLDQFEPAASLSYLSDVARLEWAWNIAYHAAEENPLSVQNLSSIPNDKLATISFNLHPSCQFITSEFPIDKIWYANQPNSSIDEITLDDGANILIVRPHESVNIHNLNPSIYHFLASLKAGQNVEQAYLMAIKNNRQINPAQTIIDLMDIGIFTDIHLKPAL